MECRSVMKLIQNGYNETDRLDNSEEFVEVRVKNAKYQIVVIN